MNRVTITPATDAEWDAVQNSVPADVPGNGDSPDGIAARSVSDGLGAVPGNEISPEVVLVQEFQSFEPELLGMMVHILGNIEDARDACQEAFVRCWNHRESLCEIQNIRGWVFRIAYNISLDLRKSAWRKRRQPLGDGEAYLTAAEQPPDSNLRHAEELRRIREAIRRLDAGERDVFLLRQNGEMSFEQVARTLDIPVGTAKSRMRRAVMKLHGLLGDSGQ